MNDFPTPQYALRYLAALKHRSVRDSRGEYWIEGVRPFVRACDLGLPIRLIVESEKLHTNALSRKLVRIRRREGVPYARLSPEQFRGVSEDVHASGVGIVLAQQYDSLPAVVRPSDTWVCMERLRSPGNLGTILRTMEAVSATGLILVGDGVDPFDRAALRASMGSSLNVSMIRVATAELAGWTQRHDIDILGLDAGGTSFWKAMSPRPAVIIVGEERQGISAALRACCHRFIGLPMPGKIDSLNVAVAAGVALYERLRQMSVG